MRPIRLEIITPVHNRREETLRCLRSLSRSILDSIEVHIIIVDDGSTDGTADAVREQYPDVEIVTGDGNLWYTAGTNRGFEAALKHDPDYILAINNDSIFDERCILNLVTCAEENPDSVVGSLLIDWETPHKIFQVSPMWDTSIGCVRHWRHQTVWTLPKDPWKVDLIVGNCVLYPAKIVREVGFMDEVKLPQYGDGEYTTRMRKRGFQLLIEPRARVFCMPNTVPSGFAKKSTKEKITELLFKKTGPYSLQRRLYSTIGVAPNAVVGVVAVGIFFVRVLLGKNAEGDWGFAQKEAPLSEVFASATVPRKISA